MKALKVLATAVVLTGFASAAYGQDAQKGSSDDSRSVYYVVHVPIEKVFLHNKGYVVEYRKTPLVSKKVYIPITWFLPAKDENGNIILPARDENGKFVEEPTPRKGEVILIGPGKNWPHMSLYYKDGVVDHFKLYLRKEVQHFTWGYISPADDLDAQFENITDIKIEYK